MAYHNSSIACCDKELKTAIKDLVRGSGRSYPPSEEVEVQATSGKASAAPEQHFSSGQEKGDKTEQSYTWQQKRNYETATIGIDFLSKTMYLEDRTVRLQLCSAASSGILNRAVEVEDKKHEDFLR
ncbi:hypothetical protein LguiB_020458 [Lonicera macranthoides]